MKLRTKLIAGLVLTLSCAIGCGGSPASETSVKPPATMAELLASIDSSNPESVTVNRYASLLRQLDEVYAEDEKRIGDLSTVAMQLLAKDGVKESILNIMEALNTVGRVIPKGTDAQKYSEYAAMYVKSRISGQNHAKATAGLSSLVEKITGLR